MTDLDRATTEAVEVLARRIRTRDAAIRGADADVADAEPFARELILTLRGRGWRPTEARLIPLGRRGRPGSGAKPPADLLAEARARCEQATGAQQAAVKAREPEAGAG